MAASNASQWRIARASDPAAHNAEIRHQRQCPHQNTWSPNVNIGPLSQISAARAALISHEPARVVMMTRPSNAQQARRFCSASGQMLSSNKTHYGNITAYRLSFLHQLVLQLTRAFIRLQLRARILLHMTRNALLCRLELPAEPGNLSLVLVAGIEREDLFVHLMEQKLVGSGMERAAASVLDTLNVKSLREIRCQHIWGRVITRASRL